MAQSSAAKKVPAKTPPVTPTHFDVPGRVKWFNTKKGFGFVVCDGISGDIFLHATVLQTCGLSNIACNRPVHVTFGRGPKGLTATYIRL